MQASSPALPAGTTNDVVVTNTDGTHGTLALAWIADFLDVPPAHPFHDFVTAVVSNGIAVGTGGGNYGVEATTLRRQMAVFLGKAKHGLCYVPTVARESSQTFRARRPSLRGSNNWPRRHHRRCGEATTARTIP